MKHGILERCAPWKNKRNHCKQCIWMGIKFFFLNDKKTKSLTTDLDLF